MITTGSARHSGCGKRRSSRSEPVVGMGPEAGLFDSEAGRAFPTLWGTPWDAVSWHARERIYIQALTEAVALTLPERSQPAKPGTGIARLILTFRSTPPASPNRARRVTRRPALRPHRVRPARISSCNMRPTMQRNVIVPSASGAQRMATGAAFRSLDVRASENIGPAVRTHRRQRQPYVDGELRLTAQALTRHRLPTLRRRRRQMRTQPPPRAHRSATARRIKSSVPAADSSQPRMSPASSGPPRSVR